MVELGGQLFQKSLAAPGLFQPAACYLDPIGYNNPSCYRRIASSLTVTGAPNDRFRGNICSEPSRTAKIFGSPRTAKNFENVSW